MASRCCGHQVWKADLAEVDELCAKLITLVPPAKALPLISAVPQSSAVPAIPEVNAERPIQFEGRNGKGPLFRSAVGRTGVLTENAMHRIDAYRMIRRRATNLGMRLKIGCHTFPPKPGDELKGEKQLPKVVRGVDFPKRHRGHRNAGSPRRLIDLVTRSHA